MNKKLKGLYIVAAVMLVVGVVGVMVTFVNQQNQIVLDSGNQNSSVDANGESIEDKAANYLAGFDEHVAVSEEETTDGNIKIVIYDPDTGEVLDEHIIDVDSQDGYSFTDSNSQSEYESFTSETGDGQEVLD